MTMPAGSLPLGRRDMLAGAMGAASLIPAKAGAATDGEVVRPFRVAFRDEQARLLRAEARRHAGRRQRLSRRALRRPAQLGGEAYPKLIHYNRLDKGGHFAAWEQPRAFSEEMRASFRSLRA